MNPLLLVLALAIPTPAPDTPETTVPPPLAVGTYSVTADCSGLGITTAGWPEGGAGMFTMGGEPPRLLKLNGSGTWEWPGSLEPARYYTVLLVPGDPTQVVSGTVEGCEVTVLDERPVAPVTTVRRPVSVEPVLDLSIWEGVALADPW
jgi:hypothetical protein